MLDIILLYTHAYHCTLFIASPDFLCLLRTILCIVLYTCYEWTAEKEAPLFVRTLETKQAL